MTFLKVLHNLDTPWSFTWLRRSTKVIARSDEKGRVALIHLKRTFFMNNPDLCNKKIHVDPLFDNFENWGKFIFPDIPHNHSLLIVSPYEPDREFFLMTCIMVKNLQIPCIFIYPVIWKEIFQQYFGKREHNYISREYYQISNASKDFKIAYMLL